MSTYIHADNYDTTTILIIFLIKCIVRTYSLFLHIFKKFHQATSKPFPFLIKFKKK